MKSLRRKQPDFEQFLKVLRRQGTPDHLPFYEHLASTGFIAERTQTRIDQMSTKDDAYWRIYVDFWLDMGYDCIPMEIPFDCPLPEHDKLASQGSEGRVVISSMADYEHYPWPPVERPLDFRPFDVVAGLLPDGVKIVGGVCMGPFEWVSQMIGTVGLSYALVDEPELVEAMFARIGSLHRSAVGQLATHPAIGALRQGDDLGFKTSTFLRPEQLQRWVFPVYQDMARLAHESGKPFILHSCGNLASVYGDLIELGVDAKHSFEDTILPVAEFKKQYGDRITPLGGLDVDFICRASEDELRAYTRRNIEECFSDGYWALGTGNSLTDYMPVQNYMTVLEEGLRVSAAS